MRADIIKSRISIPMYFRKYINGAIDLDTNHKILCPFHEDSTPSFTYSPEKGLWRCWSQCGGGDVIKLHQVNNHIETREEAIQSLAELLNISIQDAIKNPQKVERNAELDTYKMLLTKAQLLANEPNSWIELDRIMSRYTYLPEYIKELEAFIERRKLL